MGRGTALKKTMIVGSAAWKETVEKGLGLIGVSYAPAMIDQLALHAKELLAWNARTNLTAITDPYEVAVKHMVDSAAALPLLNEGSRMLDLGSGGGFPGIPLKILNPGLSLTLVDASRKKVSFLKHMIRTLGLTGCQAIHERGEVLASDPDMGEAFDVVISRAFSGLDTIFPMALPFLKAGGRIIAMKGRDIDQEERLLESVRGKRADGTEVTPGDLAFEKTVYRLPFIESERALLILSVP